MKSVHERFEKIAAQLAGWSQLRFALTGTLLALGLSVLFFSPKFWLMDHPRPGTFEWERALTFLAQCRDPFASNIEGAMRWRLLPPLLAHHLGLTGFSALLIPYAGLIALSSTWCLAAARFTGDRLSALLLTIILGGTGGFIFVTTNFGINDGWFLVALLAVSIGRTKISLLLPGLLACWVDERFLLGLPLALFCRWWLQDRPAGFARQAAWAALSLAPYLLVRGGYSWWIDDRGSGKYLSEALAIVPDYLPFTRLGWWMGFRAAWPLLLLAAFEWWRIGGRRPLLIGSGAALAGLLSVTVLAADLSRSTHILLPMLFCGGIALCRILPATQPRRLWLAAIASANLLLPYLMVTYTKSVMVWSLPLELLRLWKN